MCRRIFVILLFLTISNTSYAQKIETDLCFEGVFDNREFFSPYNVHQTILGGRTTFALGTSFDSTHYFRFGLSDYYNFGMELSSFSPDLIMYYQYKKGNWMGMFGAFPEEGLFQAPRAMISDLHHYYNPTIEGVLIQYKNKKWSQLAYVDWLNSQDSLTKEQILFGGEGRVSLNHFFIEDYWQIVHDGYTSIHTGSINDYMGLMVLMGYDFSEYFPLNKLQFKTGVLHSLYRDRAKFNDFDLNYSSYSELLAEYKMFGLRSTFNIGQSHMFYLGDLFYRSTKNYSRTDLYITPINTKNVTLQFTWSFHVANGNYENQQMLNIKYKL